VLIYVPSRDIIIWMLSAGLALVLLLKHFVFIKLWTHLEQ